MSQLITITEIEAALDCMTLCDLEFYSASDKEIQNDFSAPFSILCITIVE